MWMATITMNANAQVKPAPGSFDERATRERAEEAEFGALYDKSWNRPQEYEQAAAALRQSAEILAKRPYYPAEPILASAAAFAAIAKLPPEKRQLYVDAFKTREGALALLSRGDRNRGNAQLQKAQEQLVSALGPGNILLVYNLFNLTLVEASIGEFTTGKVHAEELLAIVERGWGKTNPATAHALFHLAKHEYGLKDFPAAEVHLVRAIAILEPFIRGRATDFHTTMYCQLEHFMARLLNDTKRFAEAEPHAHQAAEIAAFDSQKQFLLFLESQIEMARSRSGQDKKALAEITFKCLLNEIEENWPAQLRIKILVPYAEHLRGSDQQAEAERVEARIKELSTPKS